MNSNEVVALAHLLLIIVLCLFIEVSRPTGQSQIVPGTDDIAMVDEDYQALSSKEESDLDLLMSECQMAISNAEAFAEQLSKQLSVLDGVSEL